MSEVFGFALLWAWLGLGRNANVNANLWLSHTSLILIDYIDQTSKVKVKQVVLLLA